MPPLENGQISATQLLFLLLGYLVPGNLTFAVGIGAKQDAWLAAALGTALSLGLVLLYLALANRFRGLTLIAINDLVWGPYLGKVFSIGYILFFLFVSFLAVNITVGFQKEFLSTTPPLILGLMEAGVSFLLIFGGLEVLARCCQIYGFFHIPIWILLFLANLPAIDFTNFFPMFQTPWPVLGLVTLRVSIFTIDAIMGFMMIFPRVSDSKKTYGAAAKAYAVGVIYGLMGYFFTFGVLGPTSSYFMFPSLQASRIIDVGKVFTRMELLFGAAFNLGAVFKQTIYIYCMTVATGELFKLKSYQTSGVPFWILISLLSIHTFAARNDSLEFAMQVYPWLLFPLHYLYPALTLLIAVIRKLPDKI
jgi:spore germination protein KB